MSKYSELGELVSSVENEDYKQAARHCITNGQLQKLFAYTMGARAYCKDSIEEGKLLKIAFILL